MSMKKGFALLVALGLMFMCGAAMAETGVLSTSVLREDGLFGLTMDGFSSTQAHAMELKAGDKLEISADCTAGSLIVTVKQNNGLVLYSGDVAETPGVSVGISKDDIYRIVVSGQGARGTLRIAIAAQGVTSNQRGPFSRQYITGSLGYEVEYDPEAFTFMPSKQGDIFLWNGSSAEGQVNVWAIRQNVSLDAALVEMLSMDTYGDSQLTASLVDWRSARTFRMVTDKGGIEMVGNYTIIETGENEVFAFMATYPLALDETIAPALLDMLSSIRFTD